MNGKGKKNKQTINTFNAVFLKLKKSGRKEKKTNGREMSGKKIINDKIKK